ncbi:MAG: AAA family ATPase [archaeon]
MNEGVKEKLDGHRERLREVYVKLPMKDIYFNSRSQMTFKFMDPEGELKTNYIDPMTSSVIVSSVVPGSCVLYRGGHGGGKTTMIEEASTRLFDIPKKDIIEAMIRGNDDQNVNTLLAYYNIGKLLAKGEEEVKWRKFVTCPIKIIDEVNRFPSRALNGLFEIINKGRVEFADAIYECDRYEIFATENPKDVGTYPMSKPFLDRFGLCIPSPQLPSVEDLMALSKRRDDKIYKTDGPKNPLTMDQAKEMEGLVADNIHISNDGLMYAMYLGQALQTCERADFSDKAHSDLSLDQRCKDCGFNTDESLCRMTEDGFSGRGFLELQRWAKGYSFFLNAFEDAENPEVQQGVIQALVPYVLYHRTTPNNALFTKAPNWGQRLKYLGKLAAKASEAYATIKEPLAEIPRILRGDLDPDRALIKDVDKDIVVQQHFFPIVMASKDKMFRKLYEGIESREHISEQDLIDLCKTLSFETELSPRAQTFLREKAKAKLERAEYI